MTWTIQYSRQAEREIDALDPVVRRRVVTAIGIDITSAAAVGKRSRVQR